MLALVELLQIVTFRVLSMLFSIMNQLKIVMKISGFCKILHFFVAYQVFPVEVPVFLREHKNGMYRTDAYFLAKTFAEVTF